MATYSLTTTARQEEALAFTFRTRNAKRKAEGLTPYASVQEMVAAEFDAQVQKAQAAMRAGESGALVDAFDRAPVALRQRIRDDLGYSV